MKFLFNEDQRAALTHSGLIPKWEHYLGNGLASISLFMKQHRVLLPNRSTPCKSMPLYPTEDVVFLVLPSHQAKTQLVMLHMAMAIYLT